MFCIRLRAELLWRVSICAVALDLKGSNPGSKLETNSVGAQSVVHGSFVGDQVSKMPKKFEVKSCNCCTTGVEISTCYAHEVLHPYTSAMNNASTTRHLSTWKSLKTHASRSLFLGGTAMWLVQKLVWRYDLSTWIFFKKGDTSELVNTLERSSLYQSKLFKKGAGH